MANKLVTVTLPTTREGTPSTPFTPADYGGSHIFRSEDNVTFNQIGTILAPTLVFTDSNVPAGKHFYRATVFDTQSPPAESSPSAAVESDVTLPRPTAPVITVTNV